MKKFLNEVLKPTIAFTIYFIVLANVMTVINTYGKLDYVDIAIVLIILTYPVYYYLNKLIKY